MPTSNTRSSGPCSISFRAREAPATFRFEFWALSHITLKIGHGERVGIVGGNGAGKSTLLRLLARIYPPTFGHVSIRGSVAPLIEMGAGFNPELSGKDNIILNGAMLGFSRGRMLGMMDKIHEFTGLAEFAEMPLKYYSSGMYMRLAFAIATEVDPDILLIDESLGVGDAAFKDKAKARLRGLFERTKAVILVSARGWMPCASFARAASGSSTAFWSPTARSKKSSAATSKPSPAAPTVQSA